MLYRYQYLNILGGGDPYFFLYISSSWVKIRLHTENHLPGLPGSALKVCLVGLRRICGGCCAGYVVVQLITLSTPTRVEVELRLGCGWAVTILSCYTDFKLTAIFFFIFHLSRSKKGCIPKMGFIGCLEVP